MFDAAIIGAGIAGVATALRLQARGLATVVLEAHGQPGGCAGFFRRRGFSFDVGATTFVDFGPGGVGGALLASVGIMPIEGEALPGYVAWLPDRTVTLHRDPALWSLERLKALGDTPAHRALGAPGPAGGRLLARQPGRGQAADPRRGRRDPRGARSASPISPWSVT